MTSTANQKRVEYASLQGESREQVFNDTESAWGEAFSLSQSLLEKIEEDRKAVRAIERDNADFLPRGGRSRSEQIERIESEARLRMPEEVDGKKLSNEALRDAWVKGDLEDDANYVAARNQQIGAETELKALNHAIETNTAHLALTGLTMAHMDAVLGFFRKG